MTAPAFRNSGPARPGRAMEVLLAALQLGLTSFGGPIAHLGYFERQYVRERRWLTGDQYASLVALCQLLPGPASSQVGFLVGLHRAGWPGALAAWIGFTLPSALLLFAAAMLAARMQGPLATAVLHGFELVAVAVVAQAVWVMARQLCRDRATRALAVLSAGVMLALGGPEAQLLVLAIGAVGGALSCRPPASGEAMAFLRVPSRVAWSAVAIFGVLLLVLPTLAAAWPHSLVDLAGVFYRAGALVFGGGHVVLPLLQDALVPAGWMSDEAFLAGYGLAQAVPGPLFTVSAYLGAVAAPSAWPVAGAVVALVAVFLPGLLVAVAGAALWGRLARQAGLGAALTGVNAAVVGLLGAALYDPVFTTAVHSLADAAIAAAGLLLLQRWRVPPIVVVGLCVVASVALA